MNLFKKSWQIGRFSGVEIHLHISMLLIVPFMFYLFRPQDPPGWLLSLLMMTGLLGSVMLHEIGHTLVAQRFGIAVPRIVIWPLGGFTQLSRVPEKPAQKLLIDAAGPLVNFLLALFLGALWLISSFPFSLLSLSEYFWAEFSYRAILSLAVLNLFLLVFNLLPIHPLDGGNMLNALMEMLFGKAVANMVSIVVGIPFLLGLVLFGLFTGDAILLVICILFAISIGTLNPRSRRWITLGINYIFKRTGFHHLNEDYDAAVRGHTLALGKNPRDIPHLLGRAMAYVNLEEIEPALTDLETILHLDPNHALALELRGEIHGIEKEYDAALDQYERVKAIKPDWSISYFDCGGVYLDQKQYERALIEFNRAIELHSQHPIFFLARSIAHYRLQDMEAAHRDQAEAIRLSPQHALVMSGINLGIYEDQLDWALDYYGWVLAKSPKQWLACQGRADAYAVNAHFEAAISDYERAQVLAPKQAVIYLRRGLAYKNSGRPEQAANDFRQASNLANKSHLRRQAERLLAELNLEAKPVKEGA